MRQVGAERRTRRASRRPRRAPARVQRNRIGIIRVIFDVRLVALAGARPDPNLAAICQPIGALRSGLSVRDYAARVGIDFRTLHARMRAAEVCLHMETAIDPAAWRSLAEIHAAPKWLWRAPQASPAIAWVLPGPCVSWAALAPHFASGGRGFWGARNPETTCSRNISSAISMWYYGSPSGFPGGSWRTP
jgi:hypothetical protein